MERIKSKLWDSLFVALLWKNYLLKRNSPWVTVFELGTPLVLFFLLFGLRLREPVKKNGETYFRPRPLPSAGMTAVLQEFCPNDDGRDVYGYPLHNNSAIGPFLDHLHRVWSNGGFLQNNLNNLSALSRSNESFGNYSSIDLPSPNAMFGQGVQLSSLLKNVTQMRSFLTKNLSYPEHVSDQVLNSPVSLEDVLSFLGPSGGSGRTKREAQPPFAQNFTHSFETDKRKLKPLYGHPLSSSPTVSSEIDNQHLNPVTSSTIRKLLCGDQQPTTQPLSSNITYQFNTSICDPSSQARFEEASSELLKQLNRSALAERARRRPDDFDRRTRLLLQDIVELQKISLYLRSLSHIVQVIPPGSCEVVQQNTSYQVQNISTVPPFYTNSSQQNIVTTQKKNDTKANYLAMWSLMQPILCGNDKRKASNQNVTFELTSSQKFHLGVLIHILTSNPKILYAPNNSQVDDVIRKANTSFAFIGNITEATRQWQNISKQIRAIVEEPGVDDTLFWLKQNKASYANNSLAYNRLTATYPELNEIFESDQGLPNKTHLLKQLDTIDNAACGWQKLAAGVSINWFQGFATENDAVEYATTRAYYDNASIFATVVFDVDEVGRLKPHVVYKIRQNTSFTQDTTQIRLSYWRPDPYNWDFKYYEFGFVWLQDLIERSIIWETTGQDIVSPGAYVHLMPYPCFRFDVFSMDLEHIMPLAMIFSWVYTVAMLVQHIVYEKERRLKEVMKIMGLSNAVHWVAWFLSIFLQLQVSVTTIACILKFGNVLGKSNFFIIWLFFTAYATATIMFCFFLSVLFSKAKIASACSGIIYFMTYLPYAYMSIQEFVLHQTVSTFSKICGSLLSTTAFGLGAKYFAMYELSGYGIQWNNIALTPIEGDTFSLFQAMYMLVVDIFLYAILTWYIEAVFPGQYGLPRPWYFPFTASYWTGHGVTDKECCSFRGLWRHLWRGGNDVIDDDRHLGIDFDDDVLIEPEPANLPRGVSIQRLTKQYGRSKKRAVDRLSLNLYEDQITSFLGHNGAGKTTTMSILTGLIPPTSGTAYVYNCDIRSEMLEIRKSLGMCPQHNVLFDVLTVEEHLWFYARLKGVPACDISTEMEQFLADIGLEEKRKFRVNMLSGGMKRKLSVAIAFVGGSRTVILDEPTAGVDPYARRAIWDLIIKYKEGRTILLSTHHMDEADLLGDRIAIISNGKLQCVGSSMFLKSNYGDGYQLTLIKKESSPGRETSPDANSASSSSGESSSSNQNTGQKVTKFVKEQVPTAVLASDSNQEISFTLPFEAARKGCFQRLFERLPPKMNELNVKGCGLSDTTLEEVFLKVDDKSRWESEVSSFDREKAKICAEKHSSFHEKTRHRNFEQPSPSAGHSSHVIPDDDDEPLLLLSDDARNIEMPAGGSLFPMNDVSSAPDDRDIALEWLSSAPSVDDNVKFSDDATSSGQCEDESRLLDLVFGNSSFSKELSSAAPSQVPVEPSSLSATTSHSSAPIVESLVSVASTAQASNPNSCAADDDDDVDLLDLRENNDGGGSYELTPFVRNLRIFQGLLIKRFHYARRNRKAVFYQIMLPALFVCIAMTVALSLPTANDPPPLVLSPSQYHFVTQPKGNFIPLSNQRVLFPVNGSDQKDAGPEQLMDTFDLPSGVGATCVLKQAFNSSFNLDLSILNRTYSGDNPADMNLISKYFDPRCKTSFTGGIPLAQFLPPDTAVDVETLNKTLAAALAKGKDVPCACNPDGYTYVCRSKIGIKPIQSRVVTGEHLLNVTGKDPMLQYLMYTTGDFRLHRYGGLSFGEVRSYVEQSFPGWPSPLRKIAVRDAAQVFFNHKGYHSMPIYLNVLNNAILRANLPPSKGNPAAYGITAINHPMNKTAGALSLDFLLSGTDVVIAIFVIVAMSFIPASFLVFLVAEKSSRAKHLQFISGTGPVAYWLSNYVWDILNYLFPAAVCIVILQIFDLPAYTRGENAYAVVALFLLYGWSMTPMMYPASFYFDVPSTAYVCLIVLNLFVGITTVVSTFMISLFRNDARMVALNEHLESAFLIFPNYNLGRGLMELTYNEFMNEYYMKIGETDKVRSPFEWNLITRQLVAMAIEGVAGILITVLFEVNFFRRKPKGNISGDFALTPRRGLVSPEDIDVANERHRVSRAGTPNEDLINVNGVSKVYSKKQGQVLAVDKLSFGVSRGECFGLLGVNGAGKTTTFSMITGEAEVSGGDIKIDGHDISSGRAHERLAAQQTTGYCPQFDALFNELTPLEHLLLYARLRGIPPKDEQRVAKWAIEKLDLERHKDKPSADLSGGNKRKLSVAIALIGNPSLVLLDEPTTGMDPAARRFLWDLILDVTKSGRAVILTSHSMEECEVLCSKLAIMVNGKLECFGSAQHLKNRFGDGYMVSIRTYKPEDVVARFAQTFPSAVVKERHYHKVAFQVQTTLAQSDASGDDASVSLAQIFQFLEETRSELAVEDYSVSQTTLDDVFVNFAKKQRNAESVEVSSPWKRGWASMRERVSSTFRSRQAAEGVPRSTDRSNLHLRGSPESERLLDDSVEDVDDDDDQPLYLFDQTMSLSFIDSTC